MNNKIKLLIIDDDVNVVESLSMNITAYFPNFEIHAAMDGKSGLDLIKQKSPDIVLSDIMMPAMTGLELADVIKNDEQLKKTYLILFTGDVDKKDLENAIESGANDFLAKPFTAEQLNSRIYSAVRFIELQKKMNTETSRYHMLVDKLTMDFENMKSLVLNLIESRTPILSNLFKSTARASIWIAKEYGDISDVEMKGIEFAANLSYIGKTFLPDDMIKQPVMDNGITVNELMFNVSFKAREILSSVENLKNSSDILYHLYENFDGTGFPDALQSWQIPIGSRIIRVALDYFEYIYLKEMSEEDAIEKISIHSKRLYDPKLTVLLDQYISNSDIENQTIKEEFVKIFELKPGMILAKDIITLSGFILVTKGSQITDPLIKKIISHSAHDPILGNVLISK